VLATIGLIALAVATVGSLLLLAARLMRLVQARRQQKSASADQGTALERYQQQEREKKATNQATLWRSRRDRLLYWTRLISWVAGIGRSQGYHGGGGAGGICRSNDSCGCAGAGGCARPGVMFFIAMIVWPMGLANDKVWSLNAPREACGRMLTARLTPGGSLLLRGGEGGDVPHVHPVARRSGCLCDGLRSGCTGACLLLWRMPQARGTVCLLPPHRGRVPWKGGAHRSRHGGCRPRLPRGNLQKNEKAKLDAEQPPVVLPGSQRAPSVVRESPPESHSRKGRPRVAAVAPAVVETNLDEVGTVADTDYLELDASEGAAGKP
jgi:hypothetical protein